MTPARGQPVCPRGRARASVLAGLLAAAACARTVVSARDARADDGDAAPARTPLDPWLVRLHRGPESSDPTRLLPWVEEVAAEGRARAGTDVGALLLSGAASELARRGGAPARAGTLLAEALRAFSPDDPRSGLLWLDLADVRNDLGDPPGVLEALDRADAVAARLDPRDEPYPGPVLRARLRDDLRGRGDGLRRHALAAVGRHAEAATLWERRASSAPAAEAPAAPSTADAAWEWAAGEAWAAGDRERALRDIDLAIASAGNGSQAVSRVAWRIRAAFGQLTARGDAAYRPAGITDDLFTAWRAAVRDHGDRPGGFQLALDAATFASAASRTDELVEFFSLAFTSPGFAAEAARSVSRRLEIVAAARMVLAAGRPAQALAWLRLAEHHQGGPLPHTEGFRLAIDEALHRADRTSSALGVSASREPSVARSGAAERGAEAPDGAAGRLPPQPLPPGREAQPSGVPAARGAAESSGSERPNGERLAPLAVAAVAAVAVLAGAALLRVARRFIRNRPGARRSPRHGP